MSNNKVPYFRKHFIAAAASAALLPNGAWAIDLVQAPPGTTEPYVSPNVIVSIDDSGSMDYCLNAESSSKCISLGNNKWQGATDNLVPDANGNWPVTSRRINVLKYALAGNNGTGGVLRDTTLLSDNKIRFAWQAMWNNGNAPGVGGQKTSGNVVSKAGANSVNSGTVGVNSMKPLDATHRSNFINFVGSLDAKNGTPSHWMFSQADAYLRQPLNINSAWTSRPGDGTVEQRYLGCRRNYHIMMTDGRWNGQIDNVPNQTRSDNSQSLMLPDNSTVYGGANATQRKKTALYRDTANDTLADWAFYSWATPLQNQASLEGAVEPSKEYRSAPSTENFGQDSQGNPAIMDRFWNPKYDPATWPHMVTYTIGFSSMAVTWPGASTIFPPTAQVPFGYDGSFPDLVNGVRTWPAMSGENVRSLDLWHAALNGRGGFYAVTRGQDLERAFRDILKKIGSETEPDLTSTATSGSNTTRNSVGLFIGGYEPKNAWKGYIKANAIKKDGTTESLQSWGGKDTSQKLDDLASIGDRLILSWSDQISGSQFKGGVSFEWATDQNYLSTAQKIELGLNSGDAGFTIANSGKNRVDYLRGDRALEGVDPSGYTAAKPYRERKSRQGDIVNSVVWYTGAPASNYSDKGYSSFTRANKARSPMIYVGGNDGMLHGFSAVDGTEKVAYVPRGVIPSLKLLAEPAFNTSHKFFVDGSPMTGDVDVGAGVQDPVLNPDHVPDWRTLLVGALGAGGKGYFVLDVTNPDAADKDGKPGFSKINAGLLAKLDRTRGTNEAAPDCSLLSGPSQATCTKMQDEDKDIGHITAPPVMDEANPMRTTQITRMNNNRWAVVLGNGYNSVNQRPVLLVQYLDGDRELLRIPATQDAAGSGNASDNGLSAPRLVDLNGDFRPDVAYAGDNLGNMWKFDITSEADSSWNVAFGGHALFTARGPSSLGAANRPNVQPITVVPTTRANDRKMVVGSGLNAKTLSVGGMMVAFGTGRNISQLDPNSVQVQTLYSILDNTRYQVTDVVGFGKRLKVHPGAGTCTPIPDETCIPAPKDLGVGVVNAKLAQQSVTEINGGDFGRIDATDDLKKESWANFNGWYMDLPAVGERLLKSLEYYDGSNILAMYSQVPAKGSDADPDIETCTAPQVDGERQYRTLINIMDGKRPTVQIMDMLGNGTYDAAANQFTSRKKVSKGSHGLFTQNDAIFDIDARDNKEKLRRMPEQSLRPSWRQVR